MSSKAYQRNARTSGRLRRLVDMEESEAEGDGDSDEVEIVESESADDNETEDLRRKKRRIGIPLKENRAAGGTVERCLNVYKGFVKGNIIKLVMKNFLTFSYVELHPGPKMNLILGPNGTGKSTIVNAICIVFGGSLKLLGRNPELASYVRHGQTRAMLQARIYDPSARGGVQTIEREIDANGKSSFKLDNRKVPRREVDALGKRYDIQLDNLCQFMPQEKISSFSALGPSDLMTMTVRALGGTTKLEEYNYLLTSFLNASTERDTLEQKRKGLEVLLKENESVKHEVAAYKDQKRLREKIKNMQKYRYWLEAKEFKTEAERLKKIYKEFRAELIAKHDEAESRRGPLKKLRQDKIAASRTYDVALRRAAAADEDVQEALNDLEQKMVDLKYERKQKENIDKQAGLQKRKLDNAKRQLEQVQEQLKSLRDEEAIQQDIHDCREEKRTLKRKLLEVTSQIADAQSNCTETGNRISSFNANLKELKDVKRQRMGRLERDYRGITECHDWIRRNSASFQGRVHGPIFLEVAVDTEYHAKVFEQAVPRWLLAAYVVENSHDHDVLVKYERTRNRDRKVVDFQPSVISVDPDRNNYSQNSFERRPAAFRTELADLGIYSFVSDIYKAPRSIKIALNVHAGLDRIGVGDSKASGRTRALTRQNHLRSWFTPDSHFKMIVSRYDPESRSTHWRSLNGTRYLRAGSGAEDSEYAADLHAKLRAEEERLQTYLKYVNEMKSKASQLEQKLRTIEAGLHKLNKEKRDLDTLRYKLAQHSRALSSLEKSIANEDVDAQKTKAKATIAAAESNISAMAVSVRQQIKKLVELTAKSDILLAQKAQVCHAFDLENRKNSDFDEEVRQLKEQLSKHQSNYKEAIAQTKAKTAEAKAQLDISKLQEQTYLDFPKSLDELDELISEERARAQATSGATRDVVEKYERRMKQIAELERSIQEEEDRCERKHEELQRRKKAFTEWLKQNVVAMANIFSRLYAKLGCSGDLVLHNAESMGETYVDIMVSYRESQKMIPLNKNIHSGGERMVATMLYHFAMQSLTSAPFRVIDEMNQGMDSENERRILDIMMNDADDENIRSPQSFLITPKLLLDLPFNSSTVSHVIINGNMKR